MRLARRSFFAGAALAAGGFFVYRAPARAAQFEVKIGSVLAPDHPSVTTLKAGFDTIEKESGGRIHATIFPNNQLGNETAMFGQLRVGALQIMIISPGFLSSVVPVTEISSVGFVFKDSEDALRVVNGPLNDYLRDQIGAQNLYAFRGMIDGGMYQTGSATKPIRTPDDLAGFKIRTVGRITNDLFKELGANPVSLNLAEVYTGLQTHLIDGESAPAVVIETSKFYEVQRYLCLTNHAWSAEWLVANGDFWKSLTPDLQAIVERNHAKFLAASAARVRTEDLSMIARLKSQGLAVNEVDQAPFRARLRNYYAAWANTFGPTAWGLLQSSLGRKLV